MKTEQVDVLVIGAGPAGCIAASLINKQGFKVKIVEKEQFRIILLEIVQIDVLQAQIIILTILQEDAFFIVHNILKHLLIIQPEDACLFVLIYLIFMVITKLYVVFLNVREIN